MWRSSSISIWSVVGLFLGGFFLLVFIAVLGTGISLYYAFVPIITIDIVLSFYIALFTNSVTTFVVGYSIPFVFLATINLFDLLYSFSHIWGLVFLWGLAIMIFIIGFAGGLLGRFVRRKHAKNRSFLR